MHDRNLEEPHPFPTFPQSIKSAKFLILGSFPPNKFTNRRDKVSINDQDFFYGSVDNKFWELFIQSFVPDISSPIDIEKIKTWLKQNNWVITDIVSKTKRKEDSALDSDLRVTEWNVNGLKSIFDSNEMRYVFFTSRWVEKNFNSKIKSEISIHEKCIFITLISPSRNGLRSIGRAKFLQLIRNDGESATEFRKRYYKEMLNRIYPPNVV